MIPKFHRSQNLTAADLNKLVDAINRLDKMQGDGLIQVKNMAGARTLSLNLGQLLPQIARATAMIPVVFSSSAGATGNAAQKCAYTYTLTNALTDVELGTTINPTTSPHKHQRPTVGYCMPATFGLAYYDAGTLTIAYCNEIPDAEACA